MPYIAGPSKAMAPHAAADAPGTAATHHSGRPMGQSDDSTGPRTRADATASIPFRLPLIAILPGILPDEVPERVDALIDGGFDAIEIPLGSPGWRSSSATSLGAFGDRAWIGAETVLCEDERRCAGDDPSCRGPQPAGRGRFRHCKRGIRRDLCGLADATAVSFGPWADVRTGVAYGTAHPPLPALGGSTLTSLSASLSAGSDGAAVGGELYRPGQPVVAARGNARAFRQAFPDHAP